MDELQKQLKRLGPFWAAVLVGLVVALASPLVCNDGFMSFMAGIVAGAVSFYAIRVQQLSVGVMQPPAKLYNLTPLRAMSEVKEKLSIQWFGEKKWFMDAMNQEKATLYYSFKHSPEGGSGLDQVTGKRSEKTEKILSMMIKFQRVSEGSSMQLTYSVPPGVPIDFEGQDILEQTTQVVENALLSASNT